MAGLLLPIIYLAFINLGLSDSLLGSAWPAMYKDLAVPISGAGIISIIINLGMVTSSLLSNRLTRTFGTGVMAAVSVAIMATALWGFSSSHSFVLLCLWAVPYGLGAGGLDAAINNYMAIHFASRYMSWLHCMWGIGVTIGPLIMGHALASGASWNGGYDTVALIQAGMTAILVLSLPVWNKRQAGNEQQDDGENNGKILSLKEIFRIPGVPEAMVCFFCYCSVENSAMLWVSSYMHLEKGLAVETASALTGMFCLGITIGRGLNGFVAMKVSDTQMVRIGMGILFAGVVILFLPAGSNVAVAGFVLIGLGCAPIYPSLLHATPDRFGKERSRAIIGVQIACAHIGVCVMPPLFGFIARYFSVGLLPWYLISILLLMICMNERLNRKLREGNAGR